jgi:hypothetical protein
VLLVVPQGNPGVLIREAPGLNVGSHREVTENVGDLASGTLLLDTWGGVLGIRYPNFGCWQEVTGNLGDCASGITAREPGSADPGGPGTECWFLSGGDGKCRGSCFGNSFTGYLGLETLHIPVGEPAGGTG